MHVYKTTNKITGKIYVGKEVGYKDYYLGSGKLLLRAIKKHGKENFVKETIEHCNSVEQLNLRETYWIEKLDARGNQGYNMAPGGSGGDLSKFHNYSKQDFGYYKMEGVQKWWHSLSEEQKKEQFEKQAMTRSKGWYVSRVDDPTETYVQNISKWCEEHDIDKSMPTGLNNPKSRLFQKQTKGWRIRRSDMPKLPPYENRRHIPTNNGCKGKTWKLVNGKRVWQDDK